MVKHAETSGIIGKFGEYLVAFILTQKEVHTIHADTAGFDLLATDPDRRFFTTDRVIGISVKTRQTSDSGGFSPEPPIGSDLLRASQKWKAEPWIAYVSYRPPQDDTSVEVFLFPYEHYEKHPEEYLTKAGGAISGDKLRKSGSEVRKFVFQLGLR